MRPNKSSRPAASALAARKPADVERLKSAGNEAVHLDLDDPKTFGPALAGVDRPYLLTGYTVAMLHQSKTLVELLRRPACSTSPTKASSGSGIARPPFAWHLMIETYIKASGLAWTHLHPNHFMDNLLGIMPIKGRTFPMYCGDRRIGWVAAKDLAAVLRDGPERHGGQDYWLSTEVRSGPEVAAILTDVLGQEVHCDVKGPDDLRRSSCPATSRSSDGMPSVVEFMRQVMDARMGYVGTISRRRAIRHRAALDRVPSVGDGKTGFTAKGDFRRLTHRPLSESFAVSARL